LAWNRSRASEISDRRITARVMARTNDNDNDDEEEDEDDDDDKEEEEK
jgi:hypothetical protein